MLPEATEPAFFHACRKGNIIGFDSQYSGLLLLVHS